MSAPSWPEIAVLLALAAAAHYAFWSWRLRVPGTEDEILRAETADGWSLAIARRRPRGPREGPPVLLMHGIAVNRLFMDFGWERHSLSAHLAAAGFDCFALDLRGHGASRRGAGAPRWWTFDTYLHEDVPAALDAVRRATGAEQVLWVGHSQGALLGLASCAAYPGRIAGLVAMAGPTHFHAQPRARALVRVAVMLLGRATRYLARFVAPWAGYLHPAFAQVSISTRNVDGPLYRRMLASTIENVPPGVAGQFRDWIEEDAFRSADGRDYREGLPACRMPALFLAGSHDLLAPPAIVEMGYQRWGGEKSFFVAGRAGGLSADYGHGDLIFGRRAPEEVFAVVRDWLAARWPAAPQPSDRGRA